MMLAWSFPMRTADEVGRLLRSLGKHRYVQEVDHRIHWAVDQALRDLPGFAQHAQAFEEFHARTPDLELNSRDPQLWRPAPVEDVIAALQIFWSTGEASEDAHERLFAALLGAGLTPGEHEPFASSADEPSHPELVTLDWVLLPIDELDTDRHAGALAALEDSGDEIDPSAPIYHEGPSLAAPELILGAPEGELVGDFVIWADGPYAYSDYIFRGVAKAAKLAEPPVGYRDL